MIENAPLKARFLHTISAYACLRGKYFKKYVLCLLTKIVGGKVGRCDRRRSWGETLLFDFRDFNFHVSFVKRRCLFFLSNFQDGNGAIGSTEPCSIGRATCDDFAVKRLSAILDV